MWEARTNPASELNACEVNATLLHEPHLTEPDFKVVILLEKEMECIHQQL